MDMFLLLLMIGLVFAVAIACKAHSRGLTFFPSSALAMATRAAAPVATAASPSAPPSAPAPEAATPAASVHEGAAAGTGNGGDGPGGGNGGRIAANGNNGDNGDNGGTSGLVGWLFGGNVVARVGLLILFMGVSFLIKVLIGERVIPPAVILAGVAAGAMALMAWGWKIRLSHPGIGLSVQGTALATLMLTAFAGANYYHLYAPTVAFPLLAILVAFTCALAVLQDAVWLAVFGIIGGFATPAILSTGADNHIGLFSWCAILNVGIVAIAYLRPWRPLNVLGFLCTSTLATGWAAKFYKTDYYLSLQLFLIAFLLMYIAIAIFYARKEAPRLKHYVDGTLVFGVPLAALGLQHGLMQGDTDGMAYSALAMGALYIGLAGFVKRHMGEHCRMLWESFLALGVVSATLAIPFAFDGRWIAASWALEGAGVTWAGLRQRRPLAWGFGLLAQAGAWTTFLMVSSHNDINIWMGFIILSVTSFGMALQFYRCNADTLAPIPLAVGRAVASFMLLGATGWALGGAWNQALLRSDGIAQLNWFIGSAVAIALFLSAFAMSIRWQLAARLSEIVQVLAMAMFLVHGSWRWRDLADLPSLLAGPFPSALMLAFGITFNCLTQYRAASRLQTGSTVDAKFPHLLLLFAAVAWYVLVLPPLAIWLGTLTPEHPPVSPDALPAYLALAAALAAATLRLESASGWKALRWLTVPAWLAQAIASALLLSGLYAHHVQPSGMAWAAAAVSWLAGTYVLDGWKRSAWSVDSPVVVTLHFLRIAAPLLVIWPALHLGMLPRLEAHPAFQLEWSYYVPAWATMAVTAGLLLQVERDGWPVHPMAQGHRIFTLNLAVWWTVLLAAWWNLMQDGSMAPLPYVPLLNPLDLTTGFAFLLVILYRRSGLGSDEAWSDHIRLAGQLAAFVWGNLIMLRSIAQYTGIPYRFDELVDSGMVQAMLSLVWSGTALALMRVGATRRWRREWHAGAALLAVVVAKLFLLDLANRGSIERAVTFIGVGILMLAIAYLAPMPRRQTPAPDDDRSEHERGNAA